MDCPKCHDVELLQARSKSTGVVLDHCPQCHGVWCDRGEVERMLDIVVIDLDIPRNAELSARKCPKCSRTLRAMPYRGTLVTVDACINCAGLWLDGGELQSLRKRRGFIQQRVRATERPPAQSGPLTSGGESTPAEASASTPGARARAPGSTSGFVPVPPQKRGVARTVQDWVDRMIEMLAEMPRWRRF
jgi:uncharacterized protein